MRPMLRLLLLMALLLVPLQAAAQTAAPLGRLEVALWPEYDQRAMLTIYRISLPAGAALPTTIEVPIPARIGDPTAVAQQAPDGKLVLADYTRAAVDAEWARLTIQAESAVLQVEFYDALTIEGASRSYAFVWPAGTPLSELAFEVMQPVGAAGVRIDPAPGSERVGSNGVTYFSGTLGAQDGTRETRLQVAYTKADESLTIESVPPDAGGGAPAIGAAQPAEIPASLLSLAPWLIGGLGVALLAAGVVLYLRSRREAAPTGRVRHPARRAGASEGTIDASAVFCHSCGTAAGVTDSFCRKCGTRLRS